jgi:hypothetical protein
LNGVTSAVKDPRKLVLALMIRFLSFTSPIHPTAVYPDTGRSAWAFFRHRLITAPVLEAQPEAIEVAGVPG